MAYTQQSWVDGVTPIDAERLNHIEAGVGGVADTLDALADTVSFALTASENVDLNTITTAGMYPKLVNTTASYNGPAINFCYLIVFTYNTSSNQRVTQVLIGYQTARIAIRCRSNDEWGDWTVLG